MFEVIFFAQSFLLLCKSMDKHSNITVVSPFNTINFQISLPKVI